MRWLGPALVVAVGCGGPEEPECSEGCIREEEGWCFEAEECTAYCNENTDRWSDGDREAFNACVATDPLCFTSIEDCMQEQLQ